MNILLRNDVFDLDGTLYRVLHIGGPQDRVYAIRLGVKNPLPTHWDRQLFESADFRQRLRIVVPPESNRPYKPSPADRAIADKRWRRIKDLVEGDPIVILEPQHRMQALRVHAKRTGTTDRTLFADLRRYWTGGQRHDALLGDYHCSGRIRDDADALQVERNAPSGMTQVVFAPCGQRARGRRPRFGSHEPMAISKSLRETILRIAQKHYLEDEIRSVRAVSDRVLKELFSLRDEDGKPLRSPDGKHVILKPLGQRPTFDQIRYMLRKTIPKPHAFCKRVSPTDFANNHAASHGSVLDDTIGAGDVYEIDATRIDVFIVAVADRATIIGKPTLYLVIDRATRLITGFYISLENPSWNEAKLAVLSIAGDWCALCQRLGVPFDRNDWPAAGVLPHRFFGDRGEMITYASDVLCDGLRIPITNAPSKLSQRKCIVESGFHTTQVPLKDVVPGYEPPRNARKRRGKKYDKDACLTLDELTAIYLRIVIAHNNKVITGYPLSPENVLKGLKATPINLWHSSIVRHMGAPARQEFTYLRQQLMPTDTGSVHVDGVHFRGCVYRTEDHRCASWQSVASLKKSFNVSVVFSPALVDEVLILDPYDGRKQYVGKLTSDSQAFRGYTFAEVAAVNKATSALRYAGDQSNQTLRIALDQDIESVVGPAHAAMKSETRGVQHGSRYRGAVDVRNAEARKRRKHAHGLNSMDAQVVATVETAPVDGAAVGSNVVRLRTPEPLTSQPDSSELAALTTTPCMDVDPDVLGDLLNLLNKDSS